MDQCRIPVVTCQFPGPVLYKYSLATAALSGNQAALDWAESRLAAQSYTCLLRSFLIVLCVQWSSLSGNHI